MRSIRTTIAMAIGIAVVAMAFAGVATAGNVATLKEISGVDNGDGTASYKGKLAGSKDCRKGRTVNLETTGSGAAKLGSGKTNGKGAFSFSGSAPEGNLERIYLKTKNKGKCEGPNVLLTYDEVFG